MVLNTVPTYEQGLTCGSTTQQQIKFTNFPARPWRSHLKVPGELKEQGDGLAGSHPQVHTLTGQELGQPGQLPGEGAG